MTDTAALCMMRQIALRVRHCSINSLRTLQKNKAALHIGMCRATRIGHP